MLRAFFSISFVFVVSVLYVGSVVGSTVELTPENFDKLCTGRLCLVEFYAPYVPLSVSF